MLFLVTSRGRTSNWHILVSILLVKRPLASFLCWLFTYTDRCLQTSQPLARALNIPIYIEHGQRKISQKPSMQKRLTTHPTGIGEWYHPVVPGTGLHPRPGSSESLQSFIPEINIESWPTLLYPSRKGETMEQIHDRVDTFASAFLPALKRRLPGKHQRLLLVTHGATAIALVRTFVGDRRLQMKTGCCTVSVLERKANVDSGLIIGGWKAKNIWYGDYLTGGIACEWGFGFGARVVRHLWLPKLWKLSLIIFKRTPGQEYRDLKMNKTNLLGYRYMSSLWPFRFVVLITVYPHNGLHAFVCNFKDVSLRIFCYACHFPYCDFDWSDEPRTGALETPNICFPDPNRLFHNLLSSHWSFPQAGFWIWLAAGSTGPSKYRDSDQIEIW